MLVYMLKQMEICRGKNTPNLEQINKSKVSLERIFNNFMSKTAEVLVLFYFNIISIF